MKLFAITALVILLTACQTMSPSGVMSPFYGVPRGAALILNRDLTIPANAVKVFYQRGRQVYGANQYEPFCKFEVLPLVPIPQLVHADTFVVYNTSRVTDLVASWDTHLMYARVGRLWLFDHDGPTAVFYNTHLFLRSEQQPDVYRVVCGHLQDPVLGARHLSIEQIRATLGPDFVLQLPAPVVGG